MVSCWGFWFVLLGDCVLVLIVRFLIFLGIYGIYMGSPNKGILKLLSLDSPGLHVFLCLYIFGFPLLDLVWLRHGASEGCPYTKALQHRPQPIFKIVCKVPLRLASWRSTGAGDDDSSSNHLDLASVHRRWSSWKWLDLPSDSYNITQQIVNIST